MLCVLRCALCVFFFCVVLGIFVIHVTCCICCMRYMWLMCRARLYVLSVLYALYVFNVSCQVVCVVCAVWAVSVLCVVPGVRFLISDVLYVLYALYALYALLLGGSWTFFQTILQALLFRTVRYVLRVLHVLYLSYCPALILNPQTELSVNVLEQVTSMKDNFKGFASSAKIKSEVRVMHICRPSRQISAKVACLKRAVPNMKAWRATWKALHVQNRRGDRLLTSCLTTPKEGSSPLIGGNVWHTLCMRPINIANPSPSPIPSAKPKPIRFAQSTNGLRWSLLSGTQCVPTIFSS